MRADVMPCPSTRSRARGLPAAWEKDGAFRALPMAQPDDGPLYRGVKQVPPDHTLVFQNGKITLDRVWDLEFPS